MWSLLRKIFGPTPPSNPGSTSVEQMLGRVEGRVDALERQIVGLRGSQGDVELQWAETLEKLNRWLSRVAQREKHRADRQLDNILPEQPSGDVRDELAPTARLSKSELRRRFMPAGRFTPPNGGAP